jgi:hypothetical protein
MGVTISAPRIHHQPSQAFVHRLEEPVEGQSEEYIHRRGEQVAQNAEPKERLVRGDIVGRRTRIASHKQLGGDVDERRGAVISVR